MSDLHLVCDNCSEMQYACQCDASKAPDPVGKQTAMDKSVRDMPVKVKLKAGQIIVEQGICGVVFSFPAAAWPDDPMHQREWITRLTPWWDIGGIGWTPTAQRLRDACLRAVNKLCMGWWCPETAKHPATDGRNVTRYPMLPNDQAHT